MTRRPAFAVVCCAFVIVMSGFVLAWPAGVPLYPGAALFPQLSVVLQLTIAAFAPWIICRCGTRERGRDLVELSVFSAVPPSRILLARFLAGNSALLLLTTTAMPAFLYAQQAGAVGLAAVADAAAGIVPVLPVAVAWTLACEQSGRNLVACWLAATMLTVVVVAAGLGDGLLPRALGVGVAGMTLLVVVMRADAASRYLEEVA